MILFDADAHIAARRAVAVVLAQVDAAVTAGDA
jgi:hypothetical protein